MLTSLRSPGDQPAPGSTPARRRSARAARWLGGLAVVALGALAGLPGGAAGPATASAAPIGCTTGTIYIVQGMPDSTFYRQVYAAGSTSFDALGPAPGGQYNSLAYRQADDSLYAWRAATAGDPDGGQLARVEADGSATLLGVPAGMPTGLSFNSGTVGADGAYYVSYSEHNMLYRIDIDTMTTTAITLSEVLPVADFAFRDGYLWGMGSNASRGGQLIRIDPSTGQVEGFPQTAVPGTFDFGSNWVYGNGNLGFSRNSTGDVYQATLSDPHGTPTLQLVSQASGPPALNNDGASCPGLPTDLSLDKAGPTAPVDPGARVTYTLTVTNHGLGGSSGSTVTDPLPAGLTNATTSTPGCTIASGTVTCVLGPLAAGSSSQIEVSADAPNDFGVSLTNEATVLGNEQDPDPDNNTGSHTVTTREREADLGLVKSGPAAVERGGAITWTLDVTNNGRDASTGSTVRDTIPAGVTNVATTTPGCTVATGEVSCDVGPLGVGETTRITITGQAPDAFGAALTNTATVTGDDPDPDPTNNTSTSTTLTPPPPVPPAPPAPKYDLSLRKTASSGTVRVGQTVTYTLVVRNAGPDAAPSATVVDPVPSALDVRSATTTQGTCDVAGNRVSCALGPVAAGQEVTVTVKARAMRAGRTANTGLVEPPPVPPGTPPVDPPGNNTSTSNVRIDKARLGLTKSANRRTVRGGQTVTYTLRVRNSTPSAMRNVRVCDTLPSGMAFVRSTPQSRVSKGQRCWTVKSLGAGRSKTFRLTARALRTTNGKKVNRAVATSPDALTKRASSTVRVRRASIAKAGGVTG